MSLRNLSLLTYNAYLLPEFKNCPRPAQRAALLGALAATHDLAVFQEVWGTEVSLLSKPLLHTHIIPTDNQSNSFWPNVLDLLYFYWNKNGGLWLASRQDIPHLHYERTVFPMSETWSGKGVQATLLDMAAYWGSNSTLLVVNTHLDPMNIENKFAQIAHLRGFTATLLERLQKEGRQLELMGAVVIGDFNLEVQSSKLMEAVAGRDLYGEFQARINRTPEITYDVTANSLVEWNEQVRVDYIFGLDRHELENGQVQALMPLEIVEGHVVTQPKGQEISDHWGHSVQLRPVV